ncbi:DUF4157 domain-containing protein [Vitiosangium sp. GDMCC 1.1324]|uniref:eCIS core domain-containing protein n=1 Tax=Vitiosangium sp. (strain GDMCC 1.1324) TaxID=2138576 RepID=UPI00130E7A48|nr:DUF4157 domain-containing protein [Vitiosangium sp. GDMCC 1.1324]
MPQGLDAEAAARHGHRFGDIPTTDPARGASGTGQPLSASLHQEMRRAFRTDFSDVRLHVDSSPSLHKKDAFTQGNDIHVSPEAYRPHEPPGKALLAHELTHVLQQRHGRVAQPSGNGLLNSDPGLEHEADSVGMTVAMGGSAPHLGSRPSSSGPMAQGPASAAPIQGGFFSDFFGKLFNKVEKKQVNALTKHEDLSEDKQGLLETQEEHDAKRNHKLSKAKKKGANLMASGAMQFAPTGVSTGVKLIKSSRNVYNDQQTLNKLEIAKKFAQGSDDMDLPLNHSLAQEDPSEDAVEMLEKLETVTKGKQVMHGANAIPLVGSLAGPLRKKIQKQKMQDAADTLHSGVEVNDPFSEEALKIIAKGNKNKVDNARNADQIKKLL